MKLQFLLACLIAFTTAASPAFTGEGGSGVVVRYNSNVPGSKALAEYYATKRDVPNNQVWGFNTSTNEEISRAEFKESIQAPLLKKLERSRLWEFGSTTGSDTNGNPVRLDGVLLKSDIRYAVLCYGMPLKIQHDPTVTDPRDATVRSEFRVNAAAVDSELAVLPLFKRDFPILGPLRNPVFSVTNAAVINPVKGVLMVTRLDGPTIEIARGLVDKALQAEDEGMWGRAYFDLRAPTDPGLKIGDDWIRNAAEICRMLGFETIVDTNPATFPADFPMSQIGFYCGWYDANVSGPFAVPGCEFMPGAFAYHLHSFSADTVRSTTKNWVGPLLAQGATITMGTVYEPYISGTPNVGVFAARLIYHDFTFGEAAYACQNTLSWQTTVVGDPLYRPFGKPPQLLHQQLERAHSPLLAWSHLRVVNLSLAKNTPPVQLVNYLEDQDLTHTNAILSEKLGDLCAETGKPASAIRAYQQALKDSPSPLQRIRLHLVLNEKFASEGRTQDVYENYKELVQECLNYRERRAICEKLLPLAKRLGQTNDVHVWERLIEKFSAPPPATTPTN